MEINKYKVEKLTTEHLKDVEVGGGESGGTLVINVHTIASRNTCDYNQEALNTAFYTGKCVGWADYSGVSECFAIINPKIKQPVSFTASVDSNEVYLDSQGKLANLEGDGTVLRFISQVMWKIAVGKALVAAPSVESLLAITDFSQIRLYNFSDFEEVKVSANSNSETNQLCLFIQEEYEIKQSHDFLNNA